MMHYLIGSFTDQCNCFFFIFNLSFDGLLSIRSAREVLGYILFIEKSYLQIDEVKLEDIHELDVIGVDEQ